VSPTARTGRFEGFRLRSLSASTFREGAAEKPSEEHDHENKDAYIAKMKLQLHQLEVKMDALEIKAKVSKDAAHDTYVEEMAKLRHQSKLAKAKFDDLVDTGEDKWDAMVQEMDKVRDAFVHSFNYFKSQL
jgi:hypothetical protein